MITMTDEQLERILKMRNQTEGPRISPEFNKGLFDLNLSGGKASDRLRDIASGAGELIRDWQYASKIGLGVGKDMTAFNSALLNTHLSIDQLIKVVDQNKNQFTGFFGGMAAGVNGFGRLSRELQSSDFGDRMRAFGANTEETNEILIASMDRRHRYDLQNTDDLIRASKAAFDLGTEMTALQEITGITRREQLENLKKMQADAMLQIQLARMPKEFNDFLKTNQNAFQATGMYESIRNGLAVGGKFSADMQVQMLGQFGPTVSRQIMTAVNNVIHSSGEERKQAMETLKQLQNNAVEYQLSNKAADQAQLVARGNLDPKMQEGVKAAAETALRLQGVSEQLKQSLARGDDTTFTEILANAVVKIQAKPGEKEKPAPGELVTDALLKAQRAFVLDTQFAMSDGLQAGARIAGDLIGTKVGQAIVNEMSNRGIGQPQPNASSSNYGFIGESGRIGLDLKSYFERVTANGDVMKETQQQIENIAKTISGFFSSSGKAGGTDVSGFLSGSSFSNLFENFGGGSPMMLHGMENVFKPEQISSLMSKSANMSTQGLLGNLQNTFSPEKITNLINTAVSSASSNLPSIIDTATNGQVQLSNNTLDEIKSHLANLNTMMDSHLRNISSTADKQYSALKSLSPDLHS